MKEFYTVEEAAEILGIKEQTLRNYLSLGRIKSVKKYTSTVIPKSEIENYGQARVSESDAS